MVKETGESDFSKKEALNKLRENLGALVLFFAYNEDPENIGIVRVLGRDIIEYAKPFVKIDELIIPINRRETVSIRRECSDRQERLSIYTLEEVMDIFYKESDMETDDGTDLLRGIAQMV